MCALRNTPKRALRSLPPPHTERAQNTTLARCGLSPSTPTSFSKNPQITAQPTKMQPRSKRQLMAVAGGTHKPQTGQALRGWRVGWPGGARDPSKQNPGPAGSCAPGHPARAPSIQTAFPVRAAAAGRAPGSPPAPTAVPGQQQRVPRPQPRLLRDRGVQLTPVRPGADSAAPLAARKQPWRSPGFPGRLPARSPSPAEKSWAEQAEKAGGGGAGPPTPVGRAQEEAARAGLAGRGRRKQRAAEPPSLPPSRPRAAAQSPSAASGPPIRPRVARRGRGGAPRGGAAGGRAGAPPGPASEWGVS